MAVKRKISLRLVQAPATGAIVSAPPVLSASNQTIGYACGNCGTVLLHAEEGQVHNLLIHCTICGSYNSTDA
jgi:DNA-directed RNA polymerase subunit RPC12/RpoP